MTGTRNENVFERRLREIDRFDQVRKSIHDLTDEGMTRLLFDPQGAIERCGSDSELFANAADQPVGFLRRNRDDVAADLLLQPGWRIERNDLPQIQHEDAVAAIAFVDEVGRHKNRNPFLFPQALQIEPEIM